MQFIDFYDIAVYANEAWRGKFTPKEVACNAYMYTCDYNLSLKAKEPTGCIITLLNNLEEDAYNQGNGSRPAIWHDDIINHIIEGR